MAGLSSIEGVDTVCCAAWLWWMSMKVRRLDALYPMLEGVGHNQVKWTRSTCWGSSTSLTASPYLEAVTDILPPEDCCVRRWSSANFLNTSGGDNVLEIYLAVEALVQLSQESTGETLGQCEQSRVKCCWYKTQCWAVGQSGTLSMHS